MSTAICASDIRPVGLALSLVSGPGSSGDLDPTRSLSRKWSTDLSDSLFMTLLQAYRSYGGLMRLDDLLAMRRTSWPTETLATLPLQIDTRRIIGFIWNRTRWIPAFQFDDVGSVIPGAEAVLQELSPAFDDWELAMWFVTPNCWLNQCRPADLINEAPELVREAARVDRYVATGG